MKFFPLFTLAVLSVTGASATIAFPAASASTAGNNYDTTLINLKLCKKWRLIELNGQAIADMAERPAKIPYIQLDAKRRASGNSSCNQFFGTYELNPNDRITFSPMGMTRMACLNDTNIEADFMQVLSSADSYVLRNDTLVLNRARMAPLARFVKMKSMPMKKKKQ